MLKAGLKLKLKCPNCGGVCYQDTDGYEDYFTCIYCAREYNGDLTSRRMTPEQLKARYGIEYSSEGGLE